MGYTADEALELWQRKKLLTKKKAEELQAALEGHPEDVPHRAIAIFSAVGTILIGLGVILFVASNWQEFTPTMKVALLLIALLATAGTGFHLAYERRTYVKTGMALLFLSTLIYGASIFLVAQIYHLPINFWWGMLLWFLGAALLAYILESKFHLFLAVPLLVLFLGWLDGGAPNPFSEFGFLFEQGNNVVATLPMLGAGILSLGILHRSRRCLRFGENVLFHWGLFLVLAMLVATTAAKDALFSLLHLTFNPVSIAIILCSFLAFLFAFSFGRFLTREGRWSLLILALYLAFTYVLVAIPPWMGFPVHDTLFGYFVLEAPVFTWLYVMHVFLVFVCLLTIIWEGTLLRQPMVVNMGMLGLGVAIIVQYFSWVFEMFDRSVAFILGGILILALSALLERQRRHLLSRMHAQ